jgi:hypothetical protein
MSRMITLVALAMALTLCSDALADPRVSKMIDEQITAKLRAQNIVAAGRADDATLVRRIYLDLLGRPPYTTEAQAFFDDENEDKIHRLIGRLRLYPETAVHWRRVIAGWLQAGSNRQSEDELLAYLARGMWENWRWDSMARGLLDPKPEVPWQQGAASYLIAFLSTDDSKAGREGATVAVASALFGAQLQCAKCHNHPTVPAWTKAHFDGLRAFFDHTVVKRDKRDPRLDEEFNSKSTVRPLFLDGKRFDAKDRPRSKLADYVVRPEAVHFKRAVVNRVWKQLMGRGLVEPVDMIHDGNPASHPKLFDALADDFAANQFNFDRLVSSMMHSEAYLRSARWTGPADERAADSLFAVAQLRPLTGHQMAWSIAVTTGYTRNIQYDRRAEGFNVARGKGLAPALRYKWETTAEYRKLADVFRETGAVSTASQALHLSFDPLMSKVLESGKGSLVGSLIEAKNDEAMARMAFLALLSRQPTADEVALTKDHMKTAKTRLAGCQDLVWAIIGGAEFRFNH